MTVQGLPVMLLTGCARQLSDPWGSAFGPPIFEVVLELNDGMPEISCSLIPSDEVPVALLDGVPYRRTS